MGFFREVLYEHRIILTFYSLFEGKEILQNGENIALQSGLLVAVVYQ